MAAPVTKLVLQHIYARCFPNELLWQALPSHNGHYLIQQPVQKFVIAGICVGYPGAFTGAFSVAVGSRPAWLGSKFTNPTLRAGEFACSVKLSAPGVGFTNNGSANSEPVSSPCACHCLNVSGVIGGCCPPFIGNWGVLKNG